MHFFKWNVYNRVIDIIDFLFIFTHHPLLYSGVKISLIRTHEYSLPDNVAPHVQAVFNTVQFPVEMHGGPIIHGGPQITKVNL